MTSASPLDPPFVEVIPSGKVTGRIRPPGSKSLTNRALICAAFADGPSTLSGALQSEDTAVMIDAVRQIGVEVNVSDGGRMLRVDPTARTCRDLSGDAAELFIANSGTSIRFLTAALSAFGGHYRLHGVPRMHERPIGDLVQAIEPVIDGYHHGGIRPRMSARDSPVQRLATERRLCRRQRQQSVLERVDDGCADLAAGNDHSRHRRIGFASVHRHDGRSHAFVRRGRDS